MIKFKTINVDGKEVTRQFNTIEEISNDFHSEDCSLPANDDVVIEASKDGEEIKAEVFLDVIHALGIPESITRIDLSRFIDNKFEMKIVGIERTTHEWTENGEGEYIGSWDMSHVNIVSRVTKEEIFGGKIRDSIMEAVNWELCIDHIEEKDINIYDCDGYITFS